MRSLNNSIISLQITFISFVLKDEVGVAEGPGRRNC